MLTISRLLLRKQQGKVPNPGSSLLNPRSGRSRLRQAMAAHATGTQQFDEQAMFANLGGSGEAGGGGARTSALRKNRAQRKSHHVKKRVGKTVAEQAKHMTDSEWESVPLEDKHAFAKYMADLLRERPTEATEQQRRRYFETTMVDPRDLDPNSTVEDPYERLKLGLPVQIRSPQRALGVTQAAYESADASLFDPENVHKLENAMTQVKQVFTDYVQKRREGTSTEHERRQLANLTADLNVETQRHLANMFKYTEEKIRKIALEERQSQLRELERLRQLASARGRQHSGASASTESPRRRKGPRRLSTAARKAKLTASISRAVGLDVNVVTTLLRELEAQEDFMQFCEVFARLTVGKGFTHGPGDEGLDAYTESLRRLYSVDAQRLSTLDAVQYMAAKDDAHPVEWARRWYERALLVPLQQTPEYQRLRDIQEADRAALSLLHRSPETPPPPGQTGEGSAPAADGSDVPSPSEADGDGAGVSMGTAAARVLSAGAAEVKQEKVVRLVEKMFLRPDDPRLESLHERRLRYLAYLQMERQIAQARENAKLFAGVEDTPEAATCHELYQQLMRRKAELATLAERPEAGHAGADEGTAPGPAEERNPFTDPEAARLFESIRDITRRVMATTKQRRREERGQRAAGAAAARAERVAALVKRVVGGSAGAPDAAELEAALAEKRAQVSRTLLQVVERDVRTEVEWLEAMQEAERPPLLPVPEGMSYVSAADVRAWRELREGDEDRAANPFTRKQRAFQPSLLGQTWSIPDRPTLFWGTGSKAVQQALQHAAEDANRRRRGEPLAPPYPCPENPWGWRLVKDILDD